MSRLLLPLALAGAAFAAPAPQRPPTSAAIEAEGWCNSVDDDGDGLVDEAVTSPPAWYVDADGDGFGDPASAPIHGCHRPIGRTLDATDCDDGDAERHPRANEVCDGKDDDCDGVIDETDDAVATTWYADADGDGHGSGVVVSTGCRTGAAATSSDDCDDADASRWSTCDRPAIAAIVGPDQGWAVGDLDGDGLAEVAAIDDTPGLGVYAGGGRGELAPIDATWRFETGSGTAGVRVPGNVGDVDGDGRSELVLVDGRRPRVWLIDGLGASLDAEQDDADLLPLADHADFTRYAFGLHGSSPALVLSSWDDDREHTYVDVYRPRAGRRRSLAGPVGRIVDASPRMVGDLSGDGEDDLVLASDDRGARVLDDIPAGTVDAADLDTVDVGAMPLGVADLDGDGYDDLVTEGGAGSPVLAGPFPTDRARDEGVVATLPSTTDDVQVGDLDGDGSLDVLYLGVGSDDVWHVVYGPFEGGIADGASAWGPNTTQVTLVGDVDGDGASDALIGDSVADVVWILSGLDAGS